MTTLNLGCASACLIVALKQGTASLKAYLITMAP